MMYSAENKLKVNKKRLTKTQVKEEIANGAILQPDLSEIFSVNVGDFKEQPQIYLLPSGNFLYVIDEKDFSIGGKGDIYTPEIFHRMIKRSKRFTADRGKPIWNSRDMWRYFSKVGNDLINNVNVLKDILADQLEIDRRKLDFTYRSLDLINEKLLKLEIEEIRAQYYDHLLAYIGEVIRLRVDGIWKLNETHSGGSYPYIDIGVKYCQLMPLNVLMEEFTKVMDLDLRQATANEIRARSFYFSLREGKAG